MGSKRKNSSPAKGEGLSRTDADANKKRPMSLDTSLDPDEEKEQKKARKRKKNKNPLTDSMPEIAEMELEMEIRGEKETGIVPEISADPDEGSNLDVRQESGRKRKKKNKVFNCTQHDLEHDWDDSSVIASSNAVASCQNDLNASSALPEIFEMGLETKIRPVPSIEKETCIIPEISADTDKGSNLDLRQGSGRKRKKKNKVSNCNQHDLEHDRDDSSLIASSNAVASGRNDLSVTSAPSSCLPEIVKVGLEAKIHRVPSIEKETGIVPEISEDTVKGSNLDVRQELGRKRKKKNKVSNCTKHDLEHDRDDSSLIASSNAVVSGRNDLNVTSAPSSYLPEIVEMGLERKIPGENAVAPSIEKENSGCPGSDNNEAGILPDISAPDKGSNLDVRQESGRKRKKKKKVSNCTQHDSEHERDDSSRIASSLSAEWQSTGRNSAVAYVQSDTNVTSAYSSSMLEIVGMELTKVGDETSRSDNLMSSFEKENSGVSSQMDIFPVTVANSALDSLHVHKRRKRREKKKVFDCSQNNMELDLDTSSKIKSGELEFLVKSNIDASDRVGAGDSGSTPIKTAEKNSNGSLCPSPIRGVIQYFASADVTNKQSDQLDSFKAEEVNFSFQITGTDDSSPSHSEKVCQPAGGTASGIDSQTVRVEISQESGTVDRQKAKEVASSSAVSSNVRNSENNKLEVEPMPLDIRLISPSKKKLLVLDLNGILADIIMDYRRLRYAHKPHKKVGGKAVFKRPFCDDFLKFCFERFDIGIWSSRKKYNVEDVVHYLMGDTKHKLLFSWDQSKCTMTGSKTIENSQKPLVLKELKKLWNKEEPDLPWEKGFFVPSNTLLVDDSPYKALRNPAYTAIFPHPYQFNDENDNSLGPGGDLRMYLEGVAAADDVQRYVEEYPFGQDAITATNPSWEFYKHLIESPSA